MSSTENRLEDRNKGFQRGTNESEIKKQREDRQVELRKKKRIENYVKRSRLNYEMAENLSEELTKIPEVLVRLDPSLADPGLSAYIKIVNLAKAVVRSSDRAVLSEGLEHLRKIVSCENRKPIEVLASTEIIYKFPVYLEDEDPNVKFNAAWILTNLSAADDPELLRKIVSTGVIEVLARIANGDVTQHGTQAVWALSNLAGDSEVYRNLVYNTGVFSSIIRKINTNRSLELSCISLYIWLISNLFKFKPIPEQSMVKSFLDVLPKFLVMTHEEVLSETLKCLCYITAGGSHINEVFNTSMVSRIIHLTLHDSLRIQEKAVHLLINLSNADELHIRCLIDNRLLDCISQLVKTDKPGILKDVLMIIGNIAEGKSYKNLITSSELFKEVLTKIRSHDREVRKEALIVIGICLKNRENIESVLNKEFISDLISVFRTSDSDSFSDALDLLEIIFSSSLKEQSSHIFEAFNEFGGIDTLERLQGHPNEVIYNKSVFLVKEYFEGESVPMSPLYYPPDS